jgi:hypothetical protein
MGGDDGTKHTDPDGSLTVVQLELLAKLEGLFRELPPARRRALLRKLRADDTSQTVEGPESVSP